MALTQITSNLSLSNNGQSPTTPSLVVAVNADGTPISGGGGGGGGDVNVATFGGSAVQLGQQTIAESLPVTIASNQAPVAVNMNQVGSTIFTLGQHTKTNSMSAVIASDQIVPVSMMSGSDSVSSVSIAGTAHTTFGPTFAFLTGLSIVALEPVADGNPATLQFIGITAGTPVFSLNLPTNATAGGPASGNVLNLTGLRIPIPSGAFALALTAALTSGSYQISGSFSST